MNFNFGEYKTSVYINREIPDINTISHDYQLIVADENTLPIAKKICGNREQCFCILKSGEENKNWHAVETILSAAAKAGLGRDGVIIAVGGGVIGDLAGFAASIYKRGCRFVLVSTTLLGMVDASVGGKTGIDLFGYKNFCGSFYPAEDVYIPVDALSTLSQKDWKSGLAELIKTAILSGDEFFDQLATANYQLDYTKLYNIDLLMGFIKKAISYKGDIVSGDFKESEFGKRKLLNLGHTFGHALESVTGLGTISHGEAVAWGICRACELGVLLGITPEHRGKKICELLKSLGYECSSPHPLADNIEMLLNAMNTDKKNIQGKLTFIVPDENSARSVVIDDKSILNKILTGAVTL